MKTFLTAGEIATHYGISVALVRREFPRLEL